MACALTVSSPAPAPAPTTPLPSGFVYARVGARQALTPEVAQFDLVFDEQLLGVAAGSHFEVLVPLACETDAGQGVDALGAGPEVRHYSVCTVNGSEASIAVRREEGGRGGSLWLHENLQVGKSLAVRGPRNTFAFHPKGRSLLIAGGIGITPLLSMIAEAEARGAHWNLVYLGRSMHTMAYAELLAGYGDRVVLWPSNERGRIDLAALLARQELNTTVYACGPVPLQQELRTLAVERDIELVIEDFSGGTPEAQDQISSGGRPSLPFTVELGDGTEVFVPADKSILEALNDDGFRVLSSCKRGTCGTCETPIIEGEAEHRDSVLSEEEQAANESMMICVSRACGDRIVLDL